MTSEWKAVAAALMALRADLDALAAEAAAALRDALPSYRSVPMDSLLAAVRRNFAIRLELYAERRDGTPEELAAVVSTVEVRARQGVPLDSILRGFSLAERLLWIHVEKALEGQPVDLQLEVSRMRFELMDVTTRDAAVVHRRVELSLDRAARERVAATLRSLLRGAVEPRDLDDAMLGLGLEPTQEHWVVRARPIRQDADRLQHELLAAAGGGALSLWREDVVGLLSRRPVAGDGFVVGVAGPVPGAGIADGYRTASRAFRTALMFDIAGVHTVQDLGALVAVATSPDVGVAIRDKYLRPLQAAGALADELLHTVEVYLSSGRRRDMAATRLHVHGNTVAYRLGRFMELTGADLDDLRTLAELWWLFQDHSGTGSGTDSGHGGDRVRRPE